MYCFFYNKKKIRIATLQRHKLLHQSVAIQIAFLYLQFYLFAFHPVNIGNSLENDLAVYDIQSFV